MFVPKAGNSQSSHKRRERAVSDESIKLPKAKRPRSAPYERDAESHTNALGELQGTLSAPHDLSTAATEKVETGKQIVIRGSRKVEPRGDKADGAVILSKTDFYIISQLPALPEQVSGLHSEPFRCTLGNGYNYALSLTGSYAIIWPYSASMPQSSPTDIYTLSIPDYCRDPEGEIPHGVLLSTAAAGTPGLLIVVPSTGKIIFWENVLSAASLGVSKQKQNGHQGLISGLLSGEYATDIVNGEPAGVFVTFSTGRVAHITVRDAQGKPLIKSHFLRSRVDRRSGGLFGGIRNILSGTSWRKDVAATRAGQSHQRGQRDIIIATSAGVIEIWDAHWNSESVLKRQLDVKKDIVDSIGADGIDGLRDQDVTILDVAHSTVRSINDPTDSEEESRQLLLVVVSHHAQDSKRLYVVQMSLSANESSILAVRPVEPHNTPAVLEGTKPRILVPKGSDTAFVVIGQSVILISLTPFPTHMSSTFQDSVNFRSGREYEILGIGTEDMRDTNSYPTCLVIAREFGIIRISSLPRGQTESGTEKARVTAKDKLEQAVFYGSMRGNPLHLVEDNGLDFPIQDIEEAAMEICRELLRSETKFIPNAVVPLEQNLRARSKALDDLASLLMRQSGHLNRMVWWELLRGAEKLAAQRAMWKIEEGLRKSGEKRITFLSQVIGLMSDKFRTVPDTQENANDHVRHWFLYDTYRMEHVIPWIYNTLRAQKGSSLRQAQRMPEQILSASELSLAILETAFRYRDENATRYGFDEGLFEDGILSTRYENLPEFWTSQSMSYTEIGLLLDLQLDVCRAWVQKTGQAPETHTDEVQRKVAKNSTSQIRVLDQMHNERIRWLSAQGDTKSMEESITIEDAHIRQRKWHLFKLAGIGQLGDAITLAEKFRDMTVLVELIIELQDQSKCESADEILSAKATDINCKKTGEIGRKFAYYFESFGEAWADAFFTRQISMGQSGVLFAMKNFQAYVTQFLRKSTGYLQLRWINDVVGESDYDAAARTLKEMAARRESDVWCHRVELSLAKLTRLASCERDGTDSLAFRNDIKQLENRAEIAGIQDAIRVQLLPALQGAIDQKREIELAVECFGKITPDGRPFIQELLNNALRMVITRQVLDPDQLVDLLTLIDLSQLPSFGPSELCGQEFFSALRVVQLSSCQSKDPLYHSALQKLVWRRCMIRDNWETREEADGSAGTESEAFGHDTVLFQTLAHCVGGKYSEEHNQPTVYIPQSAAELQLSKTESDVLVSRFRPEQKVLISRDLDQENEVLCQYLEKGKLELWFKSLLSSARGTQTLPGAKGTVDAPGDNPRPH